MPFDLPARTSIIINLKITKRNSTSLRKVRDASLCSYFLVISYYYNCSEKVEKTVVINFRLPCARGGPGGSMEFIPTTGETVGLAGSWEGQLSNVYGDFCNSSGKGNCPAQIMGCLNTILLDVLNIFIPIETCQQFLYNGAHCLSILFLSPEPEKHDCVLTTLSQLIYCAGSTLAPPKKFIKLLKFLVALPGYIQCAAGFYKDCFSKRTKRSIETININSPFLYKDDLSPVVAEAFIAFLNANEMLRVAYGDSDEFVLDEATFRRIVEFGADSSDSGKYISANEYAQLEASTRPNWLRHFVQRLNNTIARSESSPVDNSTNYINSTIMSEKSAKYKSDMKRANEFGFTSIFEWLMNTAKAFDKAPIKKGVCAKVTIRLNQQLILTREIFEAELQMLNTEDVDLTSVNISIYVKRTNDSVYVDDYFHIDSPTLTLFTSIDGKGILKSGQRGQAKWLLTPTKKAAPTHPVEYLVDGVVQYKLNNVDVAIDISPEKITVKPDPSLILLYFMEKYVQSDDPMTQAIEPTIPFSLGLLIINNGYGVARNLKIQTSQPEIIDNRAGLLIDFKITRFYLNNMLEASSLNILFGDIDALEVKHGVWWMEASLKGTFRRLNATLIETRASGQQISLIDRVEYKELIKTVKLNRKGDDDLSDFLALEGAKYKVYPSNSPLSPLDVVYVSNVSVAEADESKIRLRIDVSYSCWFLAQVKVKIDLNNVYVLDTRLSNGKVLPRENSWLNHFDEENWIVSIFDRHDGGEAKFVEYSVELTKDSSLITTTRRLKTSTRGLVPVWKTNKSFLRDKRNYMLIFLFGIVITACLMVIGALFLFLLNKVKNNRQRLKQENMGNQQEQRKLLHRKETNQSFGGKTNQPTQSH